MKNLTKTDPGWKVLDHTADIRLEIHGDTLKSLFVNAAQGFFSLLAEPVEEVPSTELDVVLEADTPEDLLVDWLREMLYLHQTQGFILTRAQIVDLSPHCVKARLLGRVRSPDEEPPIEIKGVTYHALSIDRTEEGYVTRVVLDI